MNCVQTPEALTSLRERWLRAGVTTNFFLNPAQVLAAVADARLFVAEEENAAFVLCREAPCDRLYLFSDGWAPVAWRPERTTTFEIALRSAVDEARVSRFLTELGFSFGLRRLRMRRPPKALEHTAAFSIGPCSEQEALSFLHRYFDVLFGCVPDKLGTVLACRSGETLKGVIHYTVQGAVAEIRHLAVAEDLRGSGLASALICAMLQACGNPLTRVWVREENTAARRVYEKNGFIPDGRTSVAYLYR